MMGMQQQVEAERRRRGLSVRKAALAGGVSNTTWARYENGGPLTNGMRRAVAKAFDWPTTWPDDDDEAVTFAPADPANLIELTRQLSELITRLQDYDQRLDRVERAAVQASESLAVVLQRADDVGPKLDRIVEFVGWREADLSRGRGG